MKINTFFQRFTVHLILVIIAISTVSLDARKSRSKPMLFGPTGIQGLVKGKTIVVSDIQKGSPAEGIISKGDVIVGIDEKKFNLLIHDITNAIDNAESNKAKGKMNLMIKGGINKSIILPTLGEYSNTAPLNCNKTNKIIANTAERLAKQKNLGRFGFEALALMATGEKKYIEAATRQIKQSKWMDLDGKPIPNRIYCTWDWSYNAIVFAEYYLLTKDAAALPPLKSFAISLAKGQDSNGMYGHQLANPNNFYRIPGYGAMNQTTLSCFLGMLLAQKCGIQDPDLDKAIKKTTAHINNFPGNGTFPYSGSGAYSGAFNNNGMSGLAAICFEIIKNSEATKFFSNSAATTYDQLNQGHASAYFNPLWTSLGAARSGPWVTAKYFKKTLWYNNTRRNYDGSWSPDWKEGAHDAVALLTYCIPRNAVIITGREMDKSIFTKKENADNVINLSKLQIDDLDPKKLVHIALNHPMPQTRRKATGLLGKYRKEMTPTYIKWLQSGTTAQKMTAIGQYGWWIKPKVKLPHLDAIGAILRNPEEPTPLRLAAIQSITYMGDPAKKFYMDILHLMDKTGDKKLSANLNKLCPHPLEENLVTDIEVLYRNALALLKSRDQGQRGAGFRMIRSLPIKDFHMFANFIDYVFEGSDPTWTSYNHPGHDVTPAVQLLASLNIKEGLDYALKIFDSRPKAKHSFRLHATWQALEAYEGNAKQALAKHIKRHGADRSYGRHHGKYLATIKKITESNNTPKLISMKEAIEAGIKK